MNTLMKMMVVIVLVITTLIGVFYIEGSKKSSDVADITVFVEVQDGAYVKITNVEGSFEQISTVGLPMGGLMEAPGLAVRITQDMKPVSDWYSVPLMNYSRTYNFRIGLYDTFSEEKPVFAYVQAINGRSQELISIQKKLLLNKSVK